MAASTKAQIFTSVVSGMSTETKVSLPSLKLSINDFVSEGSARLAVFEYIGPPDSDLDCYADSDIAGTGIVISFLVSSFLAIGCSIAACVIDAALVDEYALLPSWAQRWLNSRLSWQSTRRLEFWSKVLERTMVVTGDQQLVTGFGILIAGFAYGFSSAKGYQYFYTSHLLLIQYMAALSSSSHFACLLTLRKYIDRHPAPAYARAVLAWLLGLMITSSLYIWGVGFLIVAYRQVCFNLSLMPAFQKWDPGYCAAGEVFLVADESNFGRAVVILTPLLVPLIHFKATLQLFPKAKTNVVNVVRKAVGFFTFERPSQSHPGQENDQQNNGRMANLAEQARLVMALVGWEAVVGSPGVSYLIQFTSALVCMLFVLAQKFTTAPQDLHLCDLVQSGDGQWAFGQLLQVLLLGVPLLTAVETYFEEKAKLAAPLKPEVVNPIFTPYDLTRRPTLVNAQPIVLSTDNINVESGVISITQAAISIPERRRRWSHNSV